MRRRRSSRNNGADVPELTAPSPEDAEGMWPLGALAGESDGVDGEISSDKRAAGEATAADELAGEAAGGERADGEATEVIARADHEGEHREDEPGAPAERETEVFARPDREGEQREDEPGAPEDRETEGSARVDRETEAGGEAGAKRRRPWGMRIRDQITDVVTELSSRLSRAVLMISAVAFSTGALLASVGISQNAAHQVEADIVASTTNLVVVTVRGSSLSAESGDNGGDTDTGTDDGDAGGMAGGGPAGGEDSSEGDAAGGEVAGGEAAGGEPVDGGAAGGEVPAVSGSSDDAAGSSDNAADAAAGGDGSAAGSEQAGGSEPGSSPVVDSGGEQEDASAATSSDSNGTTSSSEAAASTVRKTFPDDTEERLEAIDTVEVAGRRLDVSMVAAEARVGRTAIGLEESASIQVRGVTSGYLHAADIEFTGSQDWMLDGEQNVAFLGETAAETLGIPVTDDTRDISIQVNGADYSIIGFLPGEHVFSDSAVIPYQRGLEIAGRDNETQVLIKTALGAGSQISAVARTAILPATPEKLSVSQVVMHNDLRGGVSDQLTRQATWIGAFLIILTVLLIANSMIVSVTARTTEIGVRRALGASRSAVAGVFWFEGAVIGALGGLAGAALAAITITGVAAFNNWSAYLNLGWIALGPVLGMVVGIVASAYPALRATRIHPAIAVRAD